MKAWQADYGGGIDSVRKVEIDTPSPGPREVLVRIRAVSLNRRELFILAGRYPLPVKPTLIPACDGAGEVVNVGSEVTAVAAGDRVIGAVFPHWLDGRFSARVTAQLGGALDGTLAEYVCLDERATIAIPDRMSFEQAATIPCAGVTAWHALGGDHGGGPGGDPLTVLTSTSGAVSLFTTQIAAARGDTVLVTTAAESNAEDLLRLGAVHVVPSGPDAAAAVLERTGGHGADLAVHNYGPLSWSVAATRLGGQVSLVTVTDAGSLDPVALFARNLTIRSISLGSVAHTRAFVTFAAEHKIDMPIAARFPFDEAHAAFRHYERRRAFGKVVIAGS